MRIALVKLHLAVFLAGFTGIFGKLITMNEGLMTFYRLAFSLVLFGLLLSVRKEIQKIRRADFFKLCGIGALLALHWTFFYGSIKYSNISIGVVCFSTTAFFTAVLDPLFSRRRVSFLEILFSSIAILGVSLIFHFDSRYRVGIILGFISAALMACYIIANKKAKDNHSPSTLLFYELLGGTLFLLALLPVYLDFFPVASIIPTGSNLAYLLLLASLFTVLLFLLQIQALRAASSFTVGVTYNLEPIYSIILAGLFFGEMREVNSYFFIGLALIAVSVLLQTLRSLRHT